MGLVLPTSQIEYKEESLGLLQVVLFGSYAKENYTVASDIDLLVVYRSNGEKDAYAIVKKIIGLFSKKCS
jgi:predicted nucleotidyltransferase